MTHFRPCAHFIEDGLRLTSCYLSLDCEEFLKSVNQRRNIYLWHFNIWTLFEGVSGLYVDISTDTKKGCLIDKPSDRRLRYVSDSSSSSSKLQTNHKPVKTDQCDQYTSVSRSWFREVQLWHRLKHLVFQISIQPSDSLWTWLRCYWSDWFIWEQSSCQTIREPELWIIMSPDLRSAESQWWMCFILSLWYDRLRAGVQTLLA